VDSQHGLVEFLCAWLTLHGGIALEPDGGIVGEGRSLRLLVDWPTEGKPGLDLGRCHLRGLLSYFTLAYALGLALAVVIDEEPPCAFPFLHVDAHVSSPPSPAFVVESDDPADDLTVLVALGHEPSIFSVCSRHHSPSFPPRGRGLVQFPFQQAANVAAGGCALDAQSL